MLKEFVKSPDTRLVGGEPEITPKRLLEARLSGCSVQRGGLERLSGLLVGEAGAAGGLLSSLGPVAGETPAGSCPVNSFSTNSSLSNSIWRSWLSLR